jgi:hypothetical protein
VLPDHLEVKVFVAHTLNVLYGELGIKVIGCRRSDVNNPTGESLHLRGPPRANESMPHSLLRHRFIGLIDH